MSGAYTNGQHIFNLIVAGEGNKIYQSVNSSAEDCIRDLDTALENKVIPEGGDKELRESVERELKEAGEIRFSLTRVDNQISREERNNPALRRFVSSNKKGEQRSLELFFDELAKAQQIDGFSNSKDLLRGLQAYLLESMRYRVEITSCWDIILNKHSNVIEELARELGDRLCALSMTLNHDQTIEDVRDLLQELNLTFDETVKIHPMPSDKKEIEMLLIRCIQSLKTHKSQLDELEHQLDELEEAYQYLNTILENSDESYEAIDLQPRKRKSDKKKPSKRMVFPNLDN